MGWDFMHLGRHDSIVRDGFAWKTAVSRTQSARIRSGFTTHSNEPKHDGKKAVDRYPEAKKPLSLLLARHGSLRHEPELDDSRGRMTVGRFG
jgi:hypothetical protein